MKIKINVNPSYNVEIEKGLIDRSGLPEGFIISDSNIYEKYVKFFIKDCMGHKRDRHIIAAGEKGKTLQNYTTIIERLGSNVEKITAFGGGVVGDLAGFVASTYKRGIDLIYVPTSLIGMVDSSIGGKNGVNVGELKNYAGTFYQPKQVLIDPIFLNSLPDEEFRNGIAEIVKYGAIFNKPKIERLKKGIKKIDVDLENILVKCCEIKAEVIEEDEFDKGYRHTLNFGHTIGHAIELLYGLRHGEAIAIGMANELRLGKHIGKVNKEKAEETIDILKVNKLPTEFPSNMNIEKIMALMKQDKKGSLVFVFDKDNYNVQVEEKIVGDFLKNGNYQGN